jgi:hypothetical protein
MTFSGEIIDFVLAEMSTAKSKNKGLFSTYMCGRCLCTFVCFNPFFFCPCCQCSFNGASHFNVVKVVLRTSLVAVTASY